MCNIFCEQYCIVVMTFLFRMITKTIIQYMMMAMIIIQ